MILLGVSFTKLTLTSDDLKLTEIFVSYSFYFYFTYLPIIKNIKLFP